jgi:hypothetical protein
MLRARSDHGGIFSGMISHPSPEAVVSELGDKVVDAIVHAVKVAKEKFARYREQHPDWAADNAARTIADLIHDWMWTDVKQQLDLLPHVNLIDKDPRREIAVRVHSEERLSYLLRIKLHHLDGRTSSYQTQTVMDFELQEVNETFPGWGEVRLEAGYEWEKDTRTMGAPVISLRHGRNRIIWVHQLPEQGGSAGATVSRPAGPGAPTLPGVEVPGRDSEEQAGTGET